VLTASAGAAAARRRDGCAPWRRPVRGRRCGDADSEVGALTVAETAAPPEGAGAGDLFDEPLDTAEHPTASTQYAAALACRARQNTPALLT
jgi:hypothetical protein